MRKTFLPLLSIIGLLILFGATFTIVTNLKPAELNPANTEQGFAQESQSIGELGGVHYLRTSKIADEGNYQRFSITTQLNRASTLEDLIETPATTAKLITGDQPFIQIKLADTTRIYTEEGAPEDVYDGINGIAPEGAEPITKVQVDESTEEGQEIRVYLTTSSKSFRLHPDLQNPGVIWVDILK